MLVQEISARFSVNLGSQGFFKYLNLELLQSNLLGLFILNLSLDGTVKPCGDQQRAPSWDLDHFSSECFDALGD